MQVSLGAALIVIAVWTIFVVVSCSVLALRQYLDDRKQAKLGDFRIEEKGGVP